VVKDLGHVDEFDYAAKCGACRKFFFISPRDVPESWHGRISSRCRGGV